MQPAKTIYKIYGRDSGGIKLLITSADLLSAINEACVQAPVGADNVHRDQEMITILHAALTSADKGEAAAQSFKPTMHNIVKLTLFLGKTGTPPNNLIVEIREDDSGNPKGNPGEDTNYLAQASINPADLPSGDELVFFDINLNSPLTPETSYWIVLYEEGFPDGIDMYNYYRIGGNITMEGETNPYPRGHSAWKRPSESPLWQHQLDADMLFITYASVNCDEVTVSFGIMDAPLIDGKPAIKLNESFVIRGMTTYYEAGIEGDVDIYIDGIKKKTVTASDYGIFEWNTYGEFAFYGDENLGDHEIRCDFISCEGTPATDTITVTVYKAVRPTFHVTDKDRGTNIEGINITCWDPLDPYKQYGCVTDATGRCSIPPEFSLACGILTQIRYTPYSEEAKKLYDTEEVQEVLPCDAPYTIEHQMELKKYGKIIEYKAPETLPEGEELYVPVTIRNAGDIKAEFQMYLFDDDTDELIETEPCPRPAPCYWKDLNPGETFSETLDTAYWPIAMPGHDWNLRIEVRKKITSDVADDVVRFTVKIQKISAITECLFPRLYTGTPFPRVAQQNPVPRVTCLVDAIAEIWGREKPWWW